MSALPSILGGAALLVWPALLNGYPLVFSDTGGLVEMGAEPYIGWDKPWVYAPFLTAFHLYWTLWLPVAAQGALTSWVLWVTQQALGTANSLVHAGVCLVLAAGSAAPWFAALLMPDLFAPLVPLCLFILAFGRKSVPLPTRAAVMALAVVAIAAHLAHLVLAAGCIAALLLIGWLQGRGRILWQPAAPLAAALALLLGINAVGHGKVAISPYGSVFALARLVGDGPGRAYLDRACPDAALRLCAWQGRLPADSDDFLWNPDGPAWGNGFDPVRLAPEAARLVPAIAAAYPWETLRAMAANTWRQLGMVRVGDALVPDHLDIAVLPRLRPYFPPAEIARYQAARQPRGLMRDAAEPFQWLHLGLLVAGAAATAGIALRCWRSDPALAALAALALAALLANAFSTGALSGPHHRYQARIAWLALLPPLLYAARAATSAGLIRTRRS